MQRHPLAEALGGLGVLLLPCPDHTARYLTLASIRVVQVPWKPSWSCLPVCSLSALCSYFFPYGTTVWESKCNVVPMGGAKGEGEAAS